MHPAQIETGHHYVGEKADGDRSLGCHNLEPGQHHSSVVGCSGSFRPEHDSDADYQADYIASVGAAVSGHIGAPDHIGLLECIGAPEHIWTPGDIVDIAAGSVGDRSCKDLELVVADGHTGSLASIVRAPRCGTDDLGAGSCCLSIAGHIADRSGRRLRCWNIDFDVFDNRCRFRVDGESQLASLAPQTGQPRPSGYRRKSRWKHYISPGPSSYFSGAAGGSTHRSLAWCRGHPKNIIPKNK